MTVKGKSSEDCAAARIEFTRATKKTNNKIHEVWCGRIDILKTHFNSIESTILLFSVSFELSLNV